MGSLLEFEMAALLEKMARIRLIPAEEIAPVEDRPEADADGATERGANIMLLSKITKDGHQSKTGCSG